MAIRLNGIYRPLSKSNKHFTVYRIAVLSIFIALAYIGRILFQFIPNVQPVTAIILIITLNMGWIDGLIVGSMSILLSNILLGMGPWTIGQIISYSLIVGLTALFLGTFYRKDFPLKLIAFASFAFLMGIVYGFVISVISVNLYGVNHFWPYYLRGIPFDLAHAAGNFAFYIILEPILSKLIKRYVLERI